MQGLVDLDGDLEAEIADVFPDGGRTAALGAGEEAAPGETVHQVFRLEDAQRRLHRRAAGLHEFCNRPLDEHEARRQAAEADVVAENARNDLVAFLHRGLRGLVHHAASPLTRDTKRSHAREA